MSRFTSNYRTRKSSISLFPILLFSFFLLLFGFIWGIDQLQKTSKDQSYELVSKSIERSITQCYALEGYYPPSLGYLKDYYGLRYDEDYYFIDYQYIASNLRPDVTIIKRDS